MKIIRKSLLALLLGLSLTACGTSRDKIINTEFTRATEAESQVSQPVSETLSETTSFDYSMVPEYTGSASVVINNNVPFFNADEKAAGTSSFETYSELDDLRRCGTAYACIGKGIMPTEERGQIGMVKPTGWHTVKYDCVDGKYLYNRCHLIAYCLAGENANEKNLITGTRYLNIEGMLPYETLTAKYMDNNPDNHVLYRVTPVFIGNELVARGVLMEGYSVEDNGAGVNFCVFCYNVQPSVEINYADGESSQNSSTNKDSGSNSSTDKVSNTNSSTNKSTGFTGYVSGNSDSSSSTNKGTNTNGSTNKGAAFTGYGNSSSSSSADKDIGFTGYTNESATEADNNKNSSFSGYSNENTSSYVVNTSSKKFHKTGCKNADKISDKNKEFVNESRDELIRDGYEPSKCCNP